MTGATSDDRRITLDAWTAAANCETQLRASQIAWNEHVMGLIEKRVKIERDMAEVQAMQTALVTYHRANQELERERRQLVRRSEQVARSVAHASWVFQGEAINPDNVNDVWISCRYLVGQADLSGSTVEMNAIECGKEAANLSCWVHPRSGDTPTAQNPRSNVRAVIDWACRGAFMPRTGTAAAKVFVDLFAVLNCTATRQLDGVHRASSDLQRELLELRKQSWHTLNFDRPPKGIA